MLGMHEHYHVNLPSSFDVESIWIFCMLIFRVFILRELDFAIILPLSSPLESYFLLSGSLLVYSSCPFISACHTLLRIDLCSYLLAPTLRTSLFPTHYFLAPLEIRTTFRCFVHVRHTIKAIADNTLMLYIMRSSENTCSP